MNEAAIFGMTRTHSADMQHKVLQIIRKVSAGYSNYILEDREDD